MTQISSGNPLCSEFFHDHDGIGHSSPAAAVVLGQVQAEEAAAPRSPTTRRSPARACPLQEVLGTISLGDTGDAGSNSLVVGESLISPISYLPVKRGARFARKAESASAASRCRRWPSAPRSLIAVDRQVVVP